MIYLDNAATTQIDDTVLNAMMPYLKQEYGNPSTVYSLGRQARKAVEGAREQVANFIGAKPEQIIFTSGGTEANNMAFFSVCDYLRQHRRTHIITSKTEHDSVLRSANELLDRFGFEVTYLDVDGMGYVNPDDVAEAITDDTGLVSVMYMNNETGTVNDISTIGQICSDREVLFHTDCVQAASSIQIDVEELQCDFLSLSSHKIHGPKGVGALYVRDTELIRPMIVGGHAQEFGYRGGTENVAGIVGFGRACELAAIPYNYMHGRKLCKKFYDALADSLKQDELDNIFHVNGDAENMGKTINLRFDNVDGETLLLLLDAKGFCVSAGSACRSKESQPSRVLTAMGIAPDDARNSIRVSFSKMNTEKEAIEAANVIAEYVKTLYKQYECNSQNFD